MRTTRSLAAAIVLLTIIAAVGLSACGSNSTKPSASPLTKTCTNTDYGFSLSYPSSLVASTDTANSMAGGAGAKLTLGFVDPNGTKVGDLFVNGIAIAIYALTTEITPALMPQVKSELEGVVAQMQQQDPAAQMTPLVSVTINGVPGYKLVTTDDNQGTRMHSVTYFLVKGKTEYQVTEQAAEQSWTQYATGLAAAVNSFAVQQQP